MKIDYVILYFIIKYKMDSNNEEKRKTRFDEESIHTITSDIIELIDKEKDNYTLEEVKKINSFTYLIDSVLDISRFHFDDILIVKFYSDRNFINKFNRFYSSLLLEESGIFNSYVFIDKFLNCMINNEVIIEKKYPWEVELIFQCLVRNKVLKSVKHLNYLISYIPICYVDTYDYMHLFLLKNISHISEENKGKIIKSFKDLLYQEGELAWKDMDFICDFLEKIDIQDKDKMNIPTVNFFKFLYQFDIDKIEKYFNKLLKLINSFDFYIIENTNFQCNEKKFLLRDLFTNSIKERKVTLNFEIKNNTKICIKSMDDIYDMKEISPFIDCKKLNDKLIHHLFEKYELFEEEYISRFNFETMKDTEIFEKYINLKLPNDIVKKATWSIIEEDKKKRFQITILKYKYLLYGTIKCPICLEDIYNIRYAKILKCGHWICRECFNKQSSKEKKKCIQRCEKDDIRISTSSS